MRLSLNTQRQPGRAQGLLLKQMSASYWSLVSPKSPNNFCPNTVPRDKALGSPVDGQSGVGVRGFWSVSSAHLLYWSFCLPTSVRQAAASTIWKEHRKHEGAGPWFGEICGRKWVVFLRCMLTFQWFLRLIFEFHSDGIISSFIAKQSLSYWESNADHHCCGENMSLISSGRDEVWPERLFSQLPITMFIRDLRLDASIKIQWVTCK